MERGTDLKDLVRPGGQETMTFEFNDKEWEVHYKKTDWRLRFNAIEKSWKPIKRANEAGDGVELDMVFDTGGYYETLLMEAIVDINGQEVTLPLLRSFDGPVITHLIKAVPGPSLLSDLAEAKKESRPSEEED